MFYRIVLKAANYLSKDLYDLTNKVFHASLTPEGLSWVSCSQLTTRLFSQPLAASYADKYMDNNTKEEVSSRKI